MKLVKSSFLPQNSLSNHFSCRDLKIITESNSLSIYSFNSFCSCASCPFDNSPSNTEFWMCVRYFLHLKKDASKLIVSELEKRLKQSVMHKDLGRQVSYQYLLRLESYKLIKHLIGEKEYEGFRIWW